MLANGASALQEAAPAGSVAAVAPDPKFEIDEFRVVGNSVLDVRGVESAVYPYLGPDKTIKDVESAREALEDAYHGAGFGTVFVDIPEQEVQAGIVRLHVTEGTMRSTRVSGARYFSGREIRSAMPSATEGAVPNLTTLQRELTKVNAQTPDRSVVPVLKAGPTPGTVDLSLKVADHLPLHGSIELNNQNTPETKPLRTLASLNYDNMFGRFDSLALQYQFTPQQTQEFGVLVASYSAHINDEGTRASILYIDSSSNIATIGALGVIGKGKIIGTRLSQPLTVAADSSQVITAGVDYKDFAQNILVDPNTELNTPIRYLNFSLDYSGSWRRDRYQWNVESTLNFGVRTLVNEDYQFENDRFGASGNYSYLRSSASFGVRLPADFTALLRLSGQYTAAPLINNEQLAIGGVGTVRGYLEAEELGDMGVASQMQLGTPVFKLFAARLSVDSFLFYDFGRVSIIEPLPGQASDHELRSLGAGLHFDSLEHVSGALTWAYPLADAQTTRAHDARVLFYIRSTW